MENIWKKVYVISQGTLKDTGEVISKSLFAREQRYEDSNVYDELNALETRDRESGLLYLLSESSESGCFLFEVRGEKPLSDHKKPKHQIDSEKAFMDVIAKKLVEAGLSTESVD